MFYGFEKLELLSKSALNLKELNLSFKTGNSREHKPLEYIRFRHVVGELRVFLDRTAGGKKSHIRELRVCFGDVRSV